ncbi:MAG: hypothetical protein ACTHN7_08205 [Solirubrobacterales bacterium]
MKYLALLLVTVIGLLALTAIGASSAFATATVLCKVKSEKENGIPTSCPAESRYPVESKMGFEGKGFKLEAAFGNVECSSGKLMLENTAVSGEPLPVKIEKFELTGCNCAVTWVNAPWNGSLSWISGGWNGTLKAEKFEFTTECFGLHCIWGASSGSVTIAELKGGDPAKLEGIGTIARIGGRSGAFCGSSAPLGFAFETPPKYYESSGPTGWFVEPL